MIPIFTSSKISEIFLYLLANEKTYTNKISKAVDSSHAFISIHINILKKEGFIISQSNGRINYLKLTKKGKEVARKIFELKELIK